MFGQVNHFQDTMGSTIEHERLADHHHFKANWKKWGPYLSERGWGTVREDNSDSMAIHGNISLMIMRAAELIAGMRMGLAGFPTAINICASLQLFGMDTIPF